MEAKELRLGNYVNYKDGGSTYMQGMVTCVSNAGKIVIDNKTWEKGENITPIELNEDLLFKLDLRKEYLSYNQSEEYMIGYWLFEDFYISKIDGFYSFCEEVDSSLFFIRKIKGLHDLQNLYYALTGEEMEVKL